MNPIKRAGDANKEPHKQCKKNAVGKIDLVAYEDNEGRAYLEQWALALRRGVNQVFLAK